MVPTYRLEVFKSPNQDSRMTKRGHSSHVGCAMRYECQHRWIGLREYYIVF